jgi:hypothetical protein
MMYFSCLGSWLGNLAWTLSLFVIYWHFLWSQKG